VRCIWCVSVSVRGLFILPERLRQNLSHNCISDTRTLRLTFSFDRPSWKMAAGDRAGKRRNRARSLLINFKKIMHSRIYLFIVRVRHSDLRRNCHWIRIIDWTFHFDWSVSLAGPRTFATANFSLCHQIAVVMTSTIFTGLNLPLLLCVDVELRSLCMTAAGDEYKGQYFIAHTRTISIERSAIFDTRPSVHQIRATPNGPASVDSE
jgi:hypothetical protein